MSGDILFSNLCLCNTFLINTHSSNYTQRPRIDLPSPIAHNTHHNFLPAIFAPCLAPLTLTQMGNIFDHTMHGTAKKLLVFVVHGHDDEKLGTARGVVHDLTEGEPVVLEVVRVTCRGRIAHVGEFALGAVRTHG